MKPLRAVSLLGLCLLTACVSPPRAPTPAKAELSPAVVPSTALANFGAARAEELESARRAAMDIEGATSKLPQGQQVRVQGLVTISFEASDGRTHEVRKFQAYDSLTVDLPLTLKGRPERDAAMSPVKLLAEVLARARGSAEIARAYAPADARDEKITVGSATAKLPGGQDITVRKLIDANVLRGFERIVVKGGPLNGQL